MAISYTAGKPESSKHHVEPGDYNFRVLSAKEDTSTSGNDMIELKLRVLLEDGTEGPSLFDYLVFTKSSLWKVDAFLQSIGQHPGEGQNVEIDVEKLIGAQGRARLFVDEYKGKKNNKVDAYLFDDGF